MTKNVVCAIFLLLLSFGYADVFGLSSQDRSASTGSQWYEECPDSLRWARSQAKKDVKKFTRKHPNGLWSGFVAVFGAKRRMCRPAIRRGYLEAARTFFNMSRPDHKQGWDPTGRYEKGRNGRP